MHSIEIIKFVYEFITVATVDAVMFTRTAISTYFTRNIQETISYVTNLNQIIVFTIVERNFKDI